MEVMRFEKEQHKNFTIDTCISIGSHYDILFYGQFG